MRAVAASVVFSLVAIAVDAGAAVLYKLVDPLGRITFADMVPEGFEGTVTRMVVDTGPKTIAPERIPEVLARTPIDHEAVVPRRVVSDEERLKVAAERVETARAALQVAQETSDASDWIYLGPNNPLGMRRMPRPEYQDRLARLEQEAAAAVNDYDTLRRQLR
jgi:hypothetical protein